MNTSLFIRRLIASGLTLATLMPALTLAQDSADHENVSMTVGEILEILPSHSYESPSYSWILTQDRTFIQAGRAPTFRYRFIQPGAYTLIAEIASGDQSSRTRRTFVIDVAMRSQHMPEPSSSDSGGLAATVPATDEEGRITLIEGSRLVKIIPTNPDIRPLALDVDTAVDSDGDGSPSNDLDADQTFFQTDATPLAIWFVTDITTQTISITALEADGNPLNQEMDVMTEEYALEQGMVTSPLEVDIVQGDGRTFTFTAAFKRPLPPSTPLLYHWEFGDGSQSLIMSPTHTFAEDGTFDVSLRVRNLADGQEVATYNQTIDVATQNLPDEPAPGDISGEPEPEQPSEEGGIDWKAVALYGGMFLGTILLGLIAYAVLSFFRRRGGSTLSDRIEAMEQTIIKKEDTAAPHLAIPVAPVAAQAAPTRETVSKREVEQNKPTPAVQPKIDEKAAPAWLKSGLTAQAPATPATQTAPPKPQPPAPAPKPQPPVQPKPATPPAPKPAPVQPKPQPTPAAQPKPVADTNVPTWLQQTPASAAPASTPKSTPAPQPPKPVTPPPATPVVAQAPIAPPAPATPKPVTPPTPTPTPVPKPSNPPATPAPAPVATPVPATPPPAAPVAQPAPAAPVTPPAPAQPTETPIAFIRAESLNPEKPKNPSEPQDIQPA